ncbi:MAG: HAD-IIB family hydrolase [Treponema sp.]|jgi:Cof subfamily protein (haloacid dehalogenase superfamily)|nr:HAD-IIB family hydrolase [Treponema sp.]
MKSKKLRILALDLDDPLLNSDLSISKRIKTAIKQAGKQGATIVLASSRIPEAMERYVRFLELDKTPGYLISKNGALVTESNTGKIIHEAHLDVKTALAICDLAFVENFPIQIYEDDIMYVSKKNEYSGDDQKMNGIRQVVVENFRAMVAEGCHKLIIAGKGEILSHVKIIFGNLMVDDVTIFSSRPNFLEIMPKGIDKKSALSIITGILEVSAGEVMVIGDSMIDEAMIRWTGTGAPDANADAGNKSIAVRVTDSANHEDEVAEAIEKYFIRKGS